MHHNVLATALFFDDCREEVGNKLSFMGQYTGDVFLPDEEVRVDKLCVLVVCQWRKYKEPHDFAFVLEATGKEKQVFKVDVKNYFEGNNFEGNDDPFRKAEIQARLMIDGGRFGEGSEILAWVLVDGRQLPAGRLRIRGPSGSARADT